MNEVGCVPSDHDAERRNESRRILDRVAREADASGHGAQGQDDDRIEYWGTRIGRALGLAITVALMAWLAYYIAWSL